RGAVRFDLPYRLALSGDGNFYVADAGNNKIRRLTPAGVVTTVAGDGIAPRDDGEGRTFSFPTGVAVDSDGNIYVADQNHCEIRKITGQAVTTLAGRRAIRGSTDGPGIAALFNGPAGMAVDSGGNIYVADRNNATVRKITPAGVVTTLAGTA